MTNWDGEEVLLGAVSDGLSLQDACRLAGVSIDALHRRRRANESFKERVERAMLVAKRSMLSVIAQKARDGDWRAADRWLQIRYASEMSPHVRTEVSGPNGGPLPTIAVDLDVTIAQRLRSSDAGMDRLHEAGYCAAGLPVPEQLMRRLRGPATVDVDTAGAEPPRPGARPALEPKPEPRALPRI